MLRTTLFAILIAFSSFLTAQPMLLMSQSLNGSDLEQYRLTRELRDFAPADFTTADRQRIADKIMSPDTPHRDRYLLLAGYLDMEAELLAVPVELLNNEKLIRSHGLALVRAGNAGKANSLLRNVRALTYDDDFTYDVVPLLIYTHQRDVYDYLIELALRENNNCLPADPHANGRIDCGYRLMEYLAPVLVDFPIPLGPSGDLETDDYRAALSTVRDWLSRHRKDYEIVTDVY